MLRAYHTFDDDRSDEVVDMNASNNYEREIK